MAAAPATAQLFQQLLAAELRSLSAEAGRRNAVLRDACDTASAKLSRLPSGPSLLADAEDVWRPLLLTCDFRPPVSGKMLGTAVGALVKLLAHGCVAHSAVGDVVLALSKLRDTADEQVQLKLLQCVTAVLSAKPAGGPGYDLSPQQLGALLSVAFSLHSDRDRRAGVVQSTAAATIDQLVTAVFDRLQSEQGADRAALVALKELCGVASGDGGQFVQAPADGSKALALDLLHTVVERYSAVLVGLPKFVAVIREDVSLLVYERINAAAAAADAAILARLYRLACAVVRRFSSELVQEQELFLCRMVSEVERGVGWHKALVLGCWRSLVEDRVFLKQLYLKFDGGARRSRVLHNVVCSMCDLVRRGYPEVAGQVVLSTDKVTAQRLVALRSDEDPCAVVRRHEPVAWALESIGAACKALAGVAEAGGGGAASGMLSVVWSPVRSTCALLLEQAVEEEVITEALQVCKHVAHACGKAGLADARDAFILCLSEHSVPARPPLTDKNVQVLKVLFSISSSLGPILGPSWYVLLKTFQQLDGMLSAASDHAQTDVAVVRSMLSDVFTGSQHLPNAALADVAEALVQLSSESVASPQQKPGRCFGLLRLSQVCGANVPRLDVVWPCVRDHLTAAVRDQPDEAVRKAVLQSASSITLAYFSGLKHLRQTGQAADGGGRWEQLQPEMIDTIRDLRVHDHTDVRVGTLELVLNVIQRAGQELVPAAWRTVMAVLSASSQQPAEVALGFKSVVLVCSDFMASLNPAALQSLIACVGHFAQQDALPDKTNVNLSSIQLTLSIADFCSGQPQRVSSAHWTALFTHLRDAATDSRPEVRQSALKTLFTALVTHGGGLPKECWPVLFPDVLLKVLERVAKAAAAAERSESPQSGGAGAAAAGRGIIVHHSRNTAAKQWHETLCTALDGVTRIVRVFPAVSDAVAKALPDVLRRVAVHLAAASAHTSSEVALVGMKGLKLLLVDVAAADCGEEQAAALWDVAWDAWERLADAAAGDSANAGVLTALVEGVAEVHSKARRGTGSAALAELASARTMRLLPLVEKVMRSPAAVEGATSPTRLQACVFDCLRAQVPYEQDCEWQAALAQLAGYLPPVHVVEDCIGADVGAAAVSSLRQFGSAKLCCRALDALEHTFSHPLCPHHVQTAAFPNIVRALSPTVMTGHITAAKYDLWSAGAQTLRSVAGSALHLYSDPSHQRYASSAWDAVCGLFSEYFAAVGRRGRHADGEAPGDVAVLDLLREVVLPHCEGRAERVLSIVDSCAAQTQSATLSEAALAALFELCGPPPDDWPHSRRAWVVAGTAAAPLTIERCTAVLRGYLAAEAGAGGCAVPKATREEAGRVLRTLRSKDIDGGLLDCEHDDDLREACPAAFGRKAVVVRLLPALAAFAVCRDEGLREELSGVLLLVAAELGLR
eukprot:TRINITY_DN5241_c0_g1_i1.p1 TRINITY_DN5241_c0_g1~~TRINITY_DN5241_c0_g1_i1.p1  ORF type:complete len:1453 (+),score=531.47 TRINITY_DN5241_c0_g1_i1:109-4359(+)